LRGLSVFLVNIPYESCDSDCLIDEEKYLEVNNQLIDPFI